jgi:hypothetical protein
LVGSRRLLEGRIRQGVKRTIRFQGSAVVIIAVEIWEIALDDGDTLS